MATFPSFTTSNFYAGNALNRLSWLRPDSAFLNAALTSSQARFLLLQHLNPLVHGAKTGGAEGTLATLSFAEVQAALGASEEGLFGPALNGLKRPDAINEKDWARATDGLLPQGLCLVFLGVDERGTKSSLPGQVSKSGAGATPDGVPYFAISVTHRAPGHSEEGPLHDLEAKLLKDGYDFVDTRTLAQAGSWEASEAALVAQARSLIDWAERQHVSVAQRRPCCCHDTEG
jgi:NAD+ diphosphatase